MTIEEKLEKLTERHEAMAQSLELFSASFTHSLNEQRDNINKLLDIAETQATEIKDLLLIASNHETRIQRIEGQS